MTPERPSLTALMESALCSLAIASLILLGIYWLLPGFLYLRCGPTAMLAAAALVAVFNLICFLQAVMERQQPRLQYSIPRTVTASVLAAAALLVVALVMNLVYHFGPVLRRCLGWAAILLFLAAAVGALIFYLRELI